MSTADASVVLHPDDEKPAIWRVCPHGDVDAAQLLSVDSGWLSLDSAVLFQPLQQLCRGVLVNIVYAHERSWFEPEVKLHIGCCAISNAFPTPYSQFERVSVGNCNSTRCLSNINLDYKVYVCYIWFMERGRASSAARSSALNVRDFPSDLLWKLKARAAQQQQTLRDYIVTVLQQAASSKNDERKTA